MSDRLGDRSLIMLGQRSARVADVQRRLRSLGLPVEDDPGYFGESTTHSVRTFQQQRGVLVDGIVGPNTWSELVDASWRLGDRPLYLRHPHLRGDDVLALQASLNALGFDAGREDGMLGADTDRAIRSFQEEYGLLPDGIFGPLSLTSLQGLRAGKPGTAAGLREELRLNAGPGLGGALVMLDPGHGGNDPGFVSARGATEADLCWDICRRLAERLAGRGVRVRFTRTEADGPDTTARARMANELEADIFVSLHLNSHESPAPEGASVHYFKSSRAGEELAERVQHHLVALGHRNCRTHGVWYSLLRETRMPAVFVEPCFLSNPVEEALLGHPDHRAAVAAALAQAIYEFFSVHAGTAVGTAPG